MEGPKITTHNFPISEIFGGKYESIIKCSSCGLETLGPSPSIFDFLISIQNSNSMENSLDQLLNEIIDLYTCPRCGPNIYFRFQ